MQKFCARLRPIVNTDLNPRHVYSEVSPREFNIIYSQVSVGVQLQCVSSYQLKCAQYRQFVHYDAHQSSDETFFLSDVDMHM